MKPINDKHIISLGINSLIVTIFYGEIIIEKVSKIINKILPEIRADEWIIISIFFLLSILIQKYLFEKNKLIVEFVKTFFIIFSLVMVVYKINQNKHFFIIKNNYKNGESYFSNKNEKPIILIITDGYVSPNEFYKYNKDSSVFEFSNKLRSKGWIVNNNSKSEEITTIHSLSSLFNFNLKVGNKKDVSSTFWGQKLLNSSLYDSLNLKGVKFYNFGILDIGKTKRFTSLYYYYPTSYYGQFFDKSMINVKYLNNDSGLLQKQNMHNHYILESLPIILNKSNKKSFYYAHLLMPHDPYQYLNEFTNKSNSNPDKYFEYWKFTNKKLEILLNKLSKENKYRIIVTGDHGYGDIGGGIKAEQTYTAYYGFDYTLIQNISSVQDIGNLINWSF
jgi:hypothetical protein